nr:IS110 family transposase [Fervidicola ferrireducens]
MPLYIAADPQLGLFALHEEIRKRMLPFEEALALLDQFPSAAHLCSWAGLYPGQNESAG